MQGEIIKENGAYYCTKQKRPHLSMWASVFALPILSGKARYCRAVRNSPVDCCRRKANID